MSIQFNDRHDLTTVKLDGRVVGYIMRMAYGKGWFYSPKGASKEANGQVLPTLQAVKRSLTGAAE